MRKVQPSHLSAYCLTLPSGHPMSFGRPPEEEQLEMFSLIESRLRQLELQPYELSNFAKPQQESKHNMLYWEHDAFWGLGLSAHSYLPEHTKPMRFWNPSSMKHYAKSLTNNSVPTPSLEASLKPNHFEHLNTLERLTDYCYTHLRLTKGLPLKGLQHAFSPQERQDVLSAAKPLIKDQLLVHDQGALKLTKRGKRISNYVFSQFTFSSQR